MAADGDRQPPRRAQPQHVHVDVTGGFGGPHTYPGLLLEWRRSAMIPGKWEGLVTYVEADAHGWRSVTDWVLAEHLRPVEK